ncbi:unnamed protein product, partial [Prorocentrum cordatum]
TQTAHWQAKGCACRLRGEGLLRDPATWCDGLRATRCFHSPWSHLDVRQSPTSASSGSAAQQEATADRFCTRGLRAVSRGRKQWHGHKLLRWRPKAGALGKACQRGRGRRQGLMAMPGPARHTKHLSGGEKGRLGAARWSETRN